MNRDLFKDKRIADIYEDTRSVPLDVVRGIAGSVIDQAPKKEVALFEGGIGTGRFSIPLARLLDKEGRGFLLGADNSTAMLDKLEAKLEEAEQKKLEERLAYGYADLEKRLPYPSCFFDGCLLGMAYHALDNWKTATEEVLRVLDHQRRLFIVNWPGPWVSCMFNSPDPGDIDRRVVEFWREYYRFRKSRGLSLPDRLERIYNLEEVNSFLAEKGLNEKKTEEFSWGSTWSFAEMLEAVKEPIYSFNIDIKERERLRLHRHMKDWLEKQGIDGKEQIEIEKRMKLTSWLKP